MKKIGIQFIIVILVLSTFPLNHFAWIDVEDYEELEKSIVVSEKIEGDVQLLDKETLEVILEIPDQTEVAVIEKFNEDYVLVYYVINDDENIETVIEGLIHIDFVFTKDEIEEHINARSVVQEEIPDTTEIVPSQKIESQVEEIIPNEVEENEVEEDEKQLLPKITSFSQTSLLSKQSNAITPKIEFKNIKKTSRLGHIRGGDRYIYPQSGGVPFKADASYKNKVYYIKQQATYNNEIYYLISERPSATQGVVGWMKASDMSTHTHVGVDKQSKTFYVKGNGKATTKAWGGNRDTVYSQQELSTKYKNRVFKVNLTEKVGNNIWYRGILDGKQVWLHSSYVHSPKYSSTSLLGHIRSRNVEIYPELGGTSVKAGAQYTNAVYYIKRQVVFGSGNNAETYYLLSTRASATQGVVGWVKAQDMAVKTHLGVDKLRKHFTILGTGNSYDTAWGGKKNGVHSLSAHKGKVFEVHLTEKAGSDTWYRGILDGKTVWIEAKYLKAVEEKSISLLGHIRNRDVQITKRLGDKSTAFSSGTEYTNRVYYIKKEATVNGQKYYLLSTRASATLGVVGWVKAQDMAVKTHRTVDKTNKRFYVRGSTLTDNYNNAYDTAWGGAKNLVYSLSDYTNDIFQVQLTEKAGNTTWYRGTLKGKTVWIEGKFLSTKPVIVYTDYGLTLDQAVDIQMERLKLVGSKETRDQVKYYMNPNNFINNSVQRFQFLDLSKSSGVSTAVLENFLKEKGILSGRGSVFKKAGEDFGINEAYLVAHAILETGHGTSALSNGSMRVGILENNKKWLSIEQSASEKKYFIVELTDDGWKVDSVASFDESKAKDIKTTYNMFGIGAYDGVANPLGSVTAYRNGWFSADAAIRGGAEWIKGDYINNRFNQNTLYKMRWNPDMNGGNAWKQYATDVAWASKQVENIHKIYQELGIKDLILDIPRYR